MTPRPHRLVKKFEAMEREIFEITTRNDLLAAIENAFPTEEKARKDPRKAQKPQARFENIFDQFTRETARLLETHHISYHSYLI
jgi:DNA invertase Pin-like site-specific DNA recombinase